MVWWIDNKRSRIMRRSIDVHKITIGFHFDKLYDAHDVFMLTTAGVNIINVDLTVHDKTYFDDVKAALVASEKLPEKYLSPYYKPVGLSIVISVNMQLDIDERVDIIILKDVTKASQLVGFRKQNANFSSVPILFWLSTFEIEDLNELIKISDGVVVDIENVTQEHKLNTLQLCKPVFYVEATLADDYYADSATDLQMLSTAIKLVSDRVSGIIVFDQDASRQLPIDAFRSFAKASDIAEKDVEAFKDYFDLSFQLKIPILPTRATALAASLAALKCGASIIIVLSTTGASAKLLSFSSPPCHVLAITTRHTTARRLHLYRKIIPLFYKYARADSWQEEVQNRIGFGTRVALETGLCNAGAKLVVLSHAEENTGYCNSFQIVQLPFIC